MVLGLSSWQLALTVTLDQPNWQASVSAGDSASIKWRAITHGRLRTSASDLYMDIRTPVCTQHRYMETERQRQTDRNSLMMAIIDFAPKKSLILCSCRWRVLCPVGSCMLIHTHTNPLLLECFWSHEHRMISLICPIYERWFCRNKEYNAYHQRLRGWRGAMLVKRLCWVQLMIIHCILENCRVGGKYCHPKILTCEAMHWLAYTFMYIHTSEHHVVRDNYTWCCYRSNIY